MPYDLFISMPMNSPEQPRQDRQIRVFISSTFRDMMRERDLLVKEVFPELRRKCAKRFVTFTEVDLRWGITEAQANEGQVLPLCLAEIERSRPYFIGLLGERYGWIPDTIWPEVIACEPWLKEHVQGRTSVTELEILHGVLNNPQMQRHAFFYFRDPAYANNPALTDDERWNMIERNIKADIENHGEAEATHRTEERKAKLVTLKQRIRDSKLPLAEPYPNPKTLARLIRRQFNRLIDRLYPEDQTPDLLAQERMAHEAHAKNKLFACIDRPAHIAALNAFAAPAEHNGEGLVVTGESGGGKTALLAAWARDWAKNHPEDFLFQHYFGATPDSASPEGFLRRLLGELKSRFGITDDIPTDPEKLRDALPLWLAQASAKVSSLAPTGGEGRGEGATSKGPSRIVLVLDGLNQVQGGEPDRCLLFLPRHFPPHVVALASGLPGPALDSLRERGWTKHDLPRASEAEVDSMVGEYLKIHARTLEPELRQQLVTAPGAKNPLFLRTVLEELRQFGSFEQLPQRVRHYLEADNPKDLFLRVLRRWQEDFDGPDSDVSSLAPTGGEGHVPRPRERERVAEGRVRADGEKPIRAGEGAAHLVRRAVTHLWAARQGLSESEWLDLLGMPSPTSDLRPLTSDPLPRALWTPLFLALEPHLSQRAGFFAFGHDFLRQAVEAAFVPSDDLQQAAHISVADYFEHHPHQQEMTSRKAAEWPHQLHAAEAWDRLEACLTDLPLFLALYNDKTKWELTGYWHPLRRQGRDMGGCYSTIYARWTTVPANVRDYYVPTNLGAFLLENGLYSTAEPLLRQALEGRERVLGPKHSDTLASVGNLAVLLYEKGNYTGAEPLFRLALDGYEHVLGPEHPDTLKIVNNLGGLLARKGDYVGAEVLNRRLIEARERALGPDHPETLTSVLNLGSVLERKGDYAGAEPLHRRALEGCERVLGPEHPLTLVSVSNLALSLENKKDYVGAEPLSRRALEARERVLGPDHPDTLASVTNLASLLEIERDYIGAEALKRRALEAHERVLGPDHPDTLVSVSNLGSLLETKGDCAGAEPLYRRALEARERVLGPDHPDTLASVSNLGSLLETKGDCAGAERLYRRALEARERVLGPDHPDTLASMNNLAYVLYGKGDSAEAEPLYRRAINGYERVLGPDHVQVLHIVNDLGGFLYVKGDYVGAECLYRRALEAQGRVLGPDHPDTLMSVSNLALVLTKKADYVGAECLYRRALEARERMLGREHPDTRASVSALALVLCGKGDSAGAETLYRRLLDGHERAEPDHVHLLGIVNNMGGLLYQKGDHMGAERLYRLALEARERVLGPEHPNTLASVSNLALVLTKKGDAVGAERLYRRALEAHERVLGPDHPDTLVSVSNLGSLLETKGDCAGAEPLYRRALEARERVLGPDHPHTLSIVNNLGGLLYRKGDYTGAEQLNRRVLEARERLLGPDHPDALASVTNLASLLTRRGDHSNAEPLYRRVLEGLLKVSTSINRAHPRLQSSVDNYVACLKRQGRSEEEIRRILG